MVRSFRDPTIGVLLAGLMCTCGHDEESSPAGVPVAPASTSITDRTIPYVADERPRPAGDPTWNRCSLFTNSDDQAAECATVSVPLDWNVTGGRTINLWVKRYRGTSQPRGQVWLLAGGPGASSADFEDYVVDIPGVSWGPTFLAMAPELEVYLLDHRGTGRSTRLGCPSAEARDSAGGSRITVEEWPDCRDALLAQWGTEGLGGFNITQAARDLGELILLTRHADEPVFIYAVSYGTLWAQRYLRLYPTQSTGVVLDSVFPPGERRFALGTDREFNQVGQRLFQYCGLDRDCSSHLGSDPWSRLATLYQRIDLGHCADLKLDRPGLRRLLGFLLTSWPVRDYLPAVVGRLERCNADDLFALANLIELVDASQEVDPLFSQVLSQHILLSELVESPLPSLADIQANVASLYVSLDVGPRLLQYYEQGWPTYVPDPDAAQYPNSTVPLLMLGGELDPEAPPSLSSLPAQHYTAPYQTLVSVPYSAGGVLAQSPIRLDEQDTVRTCGEELIQQFFAAPNALLDRRCTQRVLLPDFAGDPGIAALLFGSESVWGSP
jgi:pimeloyl-ACP methyl ester carboxylesterase